VKTVFTVAVVHIEEQALLGYKKTKIGKGYWNGFGGHVEEGESIQEAAIRELYEESGLTATEIRRCGLIAVHFRDADDEFDLNIFHVTDVEGEPQETREMKPKWFAVNDVPYREMWASDRVWWLLLLAGKHFVGEIEFDSLQSRKLLRRKIREVVHV